MIYRTIPREARFHTLERQFHLVDITITGLPCRNMQTVSRQFKQEYEDEVALGCQRTLTISIPNDSDRPL